MRNREGMIIPTDRTPFLNLSFYLIPFLLLSGWLFFLVFSGQNFEPNGYYLMHYIYTYDHGFVSRGLLGEIISWFSEVVTPEVTSTASITGAVLLIAGSSLCIGYSLKKTYGDRNRYRFILFSLVVLCILPFSFRYYFTDVKLDKYLWAITFFSVFLSEYRWSIFAVPVLCCLATLLNPVFLFCSMILISLVLLQKYHDEHFQKKILIICIVSYSLMIALGLFSLFSEKHLGFTTGEEMIRYYARRYEGPYKERLLSPEVIDYLANECLYDFFLPAKQVFPLSYKIYFLEWENWKTVLCNTIFFALPAYLLCFRFWFLCIKRSQDFLQRTIFFFCLISPAVLFLPIIASWESAKYFANNILVQLCLVVYYVVHNNPVVNAVLDDIRITCKRHILMSAVIAAYFSVFFVIR